MSSPINYQDETDYGNPSLEHLDDQMTDALEEETEEYE